MSGFLTLLAFLTTAGVAVEHVRIPVSSGVTLDAALVRPALQSPAPAPAIPLPAIPSAAAPLPAVVALHGCGGPYAQRDGSWAVELAAKGHIVLLPDSFGSRGLGSQCRVKQRTVRPSRERREDAIGAATWLAAQPGTPQGGIALVGWSNGGGTVLAAARQTESLPSGLFSRFVAFYPGCATLSRDMAWRPAEEVLILVGEKDDWTPAPPCRVLAGRFPESVSLVTYPNAYHDFDAPDRPMRVLTGLATAADGRAHAGTNVAARQDALIRVPAFLGAGR